MLQFEVTYSNSRVTPCSLSGQSVGLLQFFDGLAGPVEEEFKHFFVVVTIALLEVGAVLDVHDAAFIVEDDQHGIAEAAGVAQAAKSLLVFVGLGGVDVDVNKVFLHDIGNLLVLGDELGEAQAPRAPVAAHLADDEAAAFAGHFQSLVYL